MKYFYYAFWAIFPDAKVTVQELLEDADTLVARYVITGTLQEAFMGIAAAGQPIALPGLAFCTSEVATALSDGLVQIPLYC